MIDGLAEYVMNDEPLIGLTSDQEKQTHDAITQKILEVEGGLSDLQKVIDGLRG